MKNSEMQTQKILNYLYGEMNPQEKNSFEQELEQDRHLRNELKLHEEIDKAINKEIKVQQFRMKLEGIHQQEFGAKKEKVLNIQNKWYWAAASITVFSGTAVYTLMKSANSTDRLFNRYYEVWQPGLTTRGVETESELMNIYQLFESKKYEETIWAINQMDKSTQHSPKIMLLKGCTLMELNEFDHAIEVFNHFDSDSYTLYTDAGKWYKALCYLKKEDTDKARNLLGKIVEEDNTYSKEAIELLKKLK
ncbi:MAG: hypothetical protein M0P66_01535 [Salinivirgaceae bacterium]|nr:hypothetical protein [Salinivirgaceae bacterium]